MKKMTEKQAYRQIKQIRKIGLEAWLKKINITPYRLQFAVPEKEVTVYSWIRRGGIPTAQCQWSIFEALLEGKIEINKAK